MLFYFLFFHPTSTFLSTFTLTVAPFLTLSPVFVSLSVCRTCINIEHFVLYFPEEKDKKTFERNV